MSTTLSQRLRDLRDVLMSEESDTPNVMNLVDDCIAQAEAQEAQAIGEQTPVAQANPIIGNVHERWHELGYGNPDRLHERFRGDPWRIFYAGWIEGRAPLVAQLKDNHRPFTEARDALAEYRDKHRSPVSPEARDRAVEALMGARLLMTVNDDPKAAFEQVDQALSALRGS